MITKQMEDEYYHLLRREGYINGQYAAANTIEKFLPLLKKCTTEECCTVLIEALRGQAEEAAKELQLDREKFKDLLREELRMRRRENDRRKKRN